MSSASEDRDLGMGRSIPRRDFLNGIAIGIAGACAASAADLGAAAASVQQPAGSASTADAYPPLRSGLRGNYPASIADFDGIGSGAYARPAPSESATGEEYDLVIVGGGISGLAAAYFWRRALPNQRVLILDNHDDFGGHAKRNEFSYEGRTFISYGGTMGIATPYPYSYTAKALIAELGVQVERNSEFLNRQLFDTYGLAPATFFDQEHFGEDRLVHRRGNWERFFADAPLSAAARRDLTRLYGTNADYMTGMTIEQKRAKLDQISYQDYLLTIARVTPDALPFFLGQGGRNNKRVDTTPALEAARHGLPGFDGLGLDEHEAFREGSFTFHFPDGNASIARLLVNRLVPAAVPGKHGMLTIVQAPVDYAQLDEAKSPMRIRLRSTVVRVQHDASAQARDVRVVYRQDGVTRQVRAANCILACYNALIPHLLPELPARQKEALQYGVKVPMMYNNVLIRRWSAFQKLGVSSISAGDVSHHHQHRYRVDDRWIQGRDDPGGTGRAAPGAEPEQTGVAAERTESCRTTGVAVDHVRAVRAPNPASAWTHARGRRIRSRNRHRRDHREPLAVRLRLYLRLAERSRRAAGTSSSRAGASAFRRGRDREF